MHHNQYFFFIFVFIVFTLINTYILIRSRQALPKSKITRIIFYTVFTFLCSAFLIAMLGRNVIPLFILKILYFPGTVWMGIMIYLLLFFLFTDLIYLLFRILHHLTPEIKKDFRKIQVYSGYLLVFLSSIYGYYQFNNPHIVERKIEIEKKAGDLKNLKIVGVSDLHLGVAIDKKRLEKYVGLINGQNPDMIIIAGDLIDNNALPLEKERMWEEINKLKAPLGTYFCTGNHEYMVGFQDALKFLRKTNLNLLIDKSVVIDNSIQIIGRDDYKMSRNRKPLKELMKNLNPELPVILLEHQPFHFDESEENRVDLHFCGHTHEGQIFPLNLFINSLYELAYGYEQRGKTHFYVSSGLGLWGPPFRIGTKSEVVIFDIEFKK